MRITAQEKERTRARILNAGRRLFARHGYGAASTRDLAAASGIAAGTLFNYFPGKEALALSILAEAMERGRQAWRSNDVVPDTLAEDLFALVAAELRELGAFRPFAGEVFDVALSPFASADSRPDAEPVRLGHLLCFAEALRRHGHDADESLFASQMYWTLYLGVLAYWARDESVNQADTLALLDRSTRLFAASLVLVGTGNSSEEPAP